MQTERGNTIIGRFNLSSFTIKQHKKMQDVDHRSILTQGHSSKITQIIFVYSFNFDALITHFQMQLNNHEIYDNTLEVIEAENDLLGNRGQFSSMINFKVQQKKKIQSLYRIIIQAIGFTNSVRIKMLLKAETYNLYTSQLDLKKQRTKLIQEENIAKLIRATIRNIDIYGFPSNITPMATQLTKLLNISESFKKFARFDEAAQSDILVALSLISARRFIQGAELLKKVSSYLVKKYLNNKSGMDLSRMQRSWMQEYQSREQYDLMGLGRTYGTGRVLQGGKFLLKAAKIELLLAETISHPSLINQKLQAYSRANSYYSGNPNPTSFPSNFDLQQITHIIGPQILAFLLKMLYDKSEPIRAASVKSIEFFLETLRCSMANYINALMKTILATYPASIQSNGTFPLGISLYEQNNLTVSKNKLLIDHYHHLLETILSLLPSMAKKYLRSLFNEVIISNCLVVTLPNQIKLYLLRFSEKVISLCGADIEIPVQFLISVINLCETRTLKKDTTLNKQTLFNLTFFAQKNLDLIKNKILSKYEQFRLLSICSWINQSLLYLSQNQLISPTVPTNAFFFHQILDFIIIIYSRNIRPKVSYPLQSLLYFLNASLSQQDLPFDRILQALVAVLTRISVFNPQNPILQEIVERIMIKSKLSNLVLKELNILLQIVSLVENPHLQWLQMFLNCIPHSTFDQTYAILDKLLLQNKHILDKKIIYQIVNTLLDQYTVKGKAHQQSKEGFIKLILNQNGKNILYMVQICLLENHQPAIQKYYARKKRVNQHILDSKMLKIDYEMFHEKLHLIENMLSNYTDESCGVNIMKVLTEQNTIISIYQSIHQLISSCNFKLKLKALNIVKHFITIFSNKKYNYITEIELLVSKAVLNILKVFLSSNRQSKLHYNGIHVLDDLFDKILKVQPNQISEEQSFDQSKLSFMDGNVESFGNFKIQYPINDSIYINLRMRELTKLWGLIMGLTNSPWESIREVVLVFISKFFSLPLSNYRSSLRNKILQLIKPYLSNYLRSQDSTERLRGIKLMACVIGLATSFKDSQEATFVLNANIRYFRQYFPIIIALQLDWDEQVSQLARNLVMIIIPSELQQIIKKKQFMEKRNNSNFPQNSFCTFNLGEQFNFQKKIQASFTTNNFYQMQTLLKDTSRLDLEQETQLRGDQLKNEQEINIQMTNSIWEKLKEFRNYLVKVNVFPSDTLQKESFIEAGENLYENQNQRMENDGKDNPSQEQHLQFQDLGIIQLDDEQWGDEESQVRIAPKLPLKKIYKLSPNLAGTQKPQRIRSKRFHQNQIDHHQNIIIDQLQGKIEATPKLQIQKQLQIKNTREIKRNLERELPFIEKDQEVQVAIQKEIAKQKERQYNPTRDMRDQQKQEMFQTSISTGKKKKTTKKRKSSIGK